MVIFLLLQYIFKLYSTSKLKATWSHFIAQQFYYTRTAKDPQFNQQNYQIFSVYRNWYVSRFAIQRSRSTSTSTSTTASTTPCVATSSADREQIATSPEDDNRGIIQFKKIFIYIINKAPHEVLCHWRWPVTRILVLTTLNVFSCFFVFWNRVCLISFSYLVALRGIFSIRFRIRKDRGCVPKTESDVFVGTSCRMYEKSIENGMTVFLIESYYEGLNFCLE